jgi:hypothetical protein
VADNFTFRIDDEAFQRALRRFTLRITDLRPFWPLVVPIFIGWMREQFDSEGSFGGHPWPALSQDYAERKGVDKPGKGILVYEGDLRKAASNPKRHVLPMVLELEVDWEGEKGKPVDLEWHQKGTNKMPARPLLFGEPLPALARVELDRAAELYVEESIRLSGLRL